MKRQLGFTLVELVTVIVLLGILSTYAVSRWPSTGDLVLPNQAQLFAGHIRHLQSLAGRWEEPLRLSINANIYSVGCVNAAATPPCNNDPVIDPATNQPFQIVLENGINLANSTLDFDTLGRPVNGALLDVDSDFDLTFAAESVRVRVAPVTGFVSVLP